MLTTPLLACSSLFYSRGMECLVMWPRTGQAFEPEVLTARPAPPRWHQATSREGTAGAQGGENICAVAPGPGGVGRWAVGHMEHQHQLVLARASEREMGMRAAGHH